MRIVQLLLDSASQYERKSQRVDFAALKDEHDVLVADAETFQPLGADVVHVYASAPLPPKLFRGLGVPYVSSAGMAGTRSPLDWLLRRRPDEPAVVVSPLANDESGLVPEAVEDGYWERKDTPISSKDGRKRIGSYGRPSVRRSVEQTVARLHRFRDDVDWLITSDPPSPEVLSGVDLWVDPAVDDDDLDGFAAEALVVGTTVVATRTPIGKVRLEQGRTGLLVPPSDPNEMTHAILTTLFKSEGAESRNNAARQTASKYRARHRRRVLSRIYQNLTA
jgi:hypothetical protein